MASDLKDVANQDCSNKATRERVLLLIFLARRVKAHHYSLQVALLKVYLTIECDA